MRGRTPLAPRERALRGTSSRRRGRVAPVSEKRLVAPRSLSPEARVLWARVAPELVRLGAVGFLDRDVLAAWAEASALAAKAGQILQREGLVIRDAKGRPVKHPAIAIRNQAGAEARRLAGELGLTPVSRARLGIAEPEPEPSKRPFPFTGSGRGPS